MTNYLSQTDCDLFYKIHKNLLLFANKELKLARKFKSLKDWGEYIGFMDDAAKIRDAVFGDKEIITHFIKQNPANFTKKELLAAKSWERAVIGDFVLFKHLKSHSIFLNDTWDKAYAVLGLMGGIDEMVSIDQLPLLIKTAIIPFADKIVYDGLIMGGNVILGPNYTRTMTENYNAIKKKSEIIHSF